MTLPGKCMAIAILFPALAGIASQAMAHGLSWQQDFNPAIILNFVYADGEPLAYGEVSIFSPADSEFEYQKARTDQNGFFAFRPNQSGIWKFSAVDGQGHKTYGELAVGEQSNAAVQDVSGREAAQSGAMPKSSVGPDAKSIMLGLSIVLNVALLALWRQRRSRG